MQTPSYGFKVVLLDEAAAKGERAVQLFRDGAEADRYLAEACKEEEELDEPAAAEVM